MITLFRVAWVICDNSGHGQGWVISAAIMELWESSYFVYGRVYNSDKYLIPSMLFRGLFHMWTHKTSRSVL